MIITRNYDNGRILIANSRTYAEYNNKDYYNIIENLNLYYIFSIDYVLLMLSFSSNLSIDVITGKFFGKLEIIAQKHELRIHLPFLLYTCRGSIIPLYRNQHSVCRK